MEKSKRLKSDRRYDHEGYGKYDEAGPEASIQDDAHAGRTGHGKTVETTAGGGMITVVANGAQQIVSINDRKGGGRSR
jgi:hypothetical protein